MTDSRLGPRWVRREPPLAIAGALVGRGPAPQVLARLASMEVDPLLRVAKSDDWLLLLGPESCLPWADDVTWLGRDGPIFTPTHSQPDLPADLLARSVARATELEGFYVMTPSHSFVAPIPPAAPSQQILADLSASLAQRQPAP